MLLNRHLKSQVSWYSDQNDCHSSFPHFVVYSIDFERFKHLKNTSPCQLSPKMCTNSSDMSLSTHSFRMECNPKKKTFSINTCLLNKTKKIHVYLKRPLYTTTIATNPWLFVWKEFSNYCHAVKYHSAKWKWYKFEKFFDAMRNYSLS